MASFDDHLPLPIVMKIDEIEKTVRFHKILGDGVYGSCYVCSADDCEKFAIKRIKNDPDIYSAESFRREVEILRKITSNSNGDCSSYALCLKGTHKDKDYYYILTDYADGYIELRRFIFSDDFNLWEIFNNENLRLTILNNIYNAIKKLHGIGVAHLDIKPENILVNLETGQIKIIDFGSSCSTVERSAVEITCKKWLFGTLLYMDYRLFFKILRDDPLDISDYMNADLWAFGIICIFFENRRVLYRPYPTPKSTKKPIPLFCLMETERDLLKLFYIGMFNYFSIYSNGVSLLSNYKVWLTNYNIWLTYFQHYFDKEKKPEMVFGPTKIDVWEYEKIKKYFEKYDSLIRKTIYDTQSSISTRTRNLTGNQPTFNITDFFKHNIPIPEIPEIPVSHGGKLINYPLNVQYTSKHFRINIKSKNKSNKTKRRRNKKSKKIRSNRKQ